MNIKKLNANHLKIIAMISMFIDHFGYLCFPEVSIFRIIGRLAFPLYAYFISEGYRYTRNKDKYLLKMFLMGLLFSTIFLVLTKQVYVSVLLTFCGSIIAMKAYDKLREKPHFLKDVAIALIVLVICILSYVLQMDYSMAGILIPFLVYIANNNTQKIVFFTLGNLFAAIVLMSPLQLFGLLAVAVVVFYNGEKGKLNLKHFFWWYYPAHFILIWIISNFI